MYNAGFLVNGPYTPFDVIESLFENSPNHTPGYFLLLNLWGKSDVLRTRNRPDSDNPGRASFHRGHLSTGERLRGACSRTLRDHHRGEQFLLQLLHTLSANVYATRMLSCGRSLALSANHASPSNSSTEGLRRSWRSRFCSNECSRI